MVTVPNVINSYAVLLPLATGSYNHRYSKQAFLDVTDNTQVESDRNKTDKKKPNLCTAQRTTACNSILGHGQLIGKVVVVEPLLCLEI